VTASVLVTGATGFVGSELVAQLLATGWNVHGTARPGSRRPAHPALVWHEVDLLDEAALQQAVCAAARAAEARGQRLDVVHLAARISYRRRDRELLRRVNVDATRALLAAAGTRGVRRVCHVSSVVALGPVASTQEALDDDAPLGGLELDSGYARTKAEAEELALAAAATLDVVVASPAVVFGQGTGQSNSFHFLRQAVRGTLGPLSPPGSVSVVGLEDTARGIRLALEHGVRARRYVLSESSWRVSELLRFASARVGRRGPRWTAPPALWRLLGVPARLGDALFPEARATSEALALLGLHFRFQATRARTELGWRPRPITDVLGELLEALVREECA
jgi:dihydroflavonol-4-reductase